ncbi:MAG: RHS repeat domain-containing protein, partial [Owenweeksia sp.]
MFKRFLDPSGNYNNFVWSLVSGTTDEFEVHSSTTAYTGYPAEATKSIRFKFCSFPSGFSTFSDVDYFGDMQPDFNNLGCSGTSNISVGLVKLSSKTGTAISASGDIHLRMSLYTGQGSTATFDEDLSVSNDTNSTPEEEACLALEDNRVLLSTLIDGIWTHSTNPVIGIYEVNTEFGFTTEEVQTIRSFAGEFTNLTYGDPALYINLGALADEITNNEEDYVIAFWGHHSLGSSNTLTPSAGDSIAGDVPGVYVKIGGRGSYGDYTCHIQMEFIREGAGLRFANIVDLEKLLPKPGTGAGGITTEFLVQAKMNDDSYEWIQGVSCFELSACVNCTEVAPQVPVNCWSAFSDYTDFMDNQVSDADIITDEDDFCTSRLHRFTADYIEYLTIMGVSSQSSPYYISIAQFARVKANYYLEHYTNYLFAFIDVASVDDIAAYLPETPSSDFVTLDEFSEAQLGVSCVSDYTTYLDTATNPVSVIDFCFGYAGDYPCPLLDFQPSGPFVPEEDPCVEYYKNIVQINALQAYNNYIKEIKEDFKERYVEHCVSAAVEQFKRTSTGTADYQYTLYYYDQAGNLVRTIPPLGVTPVELTNTTAMQDIKSNRASGSLYPVNHNTNLQTTYKYNSLNQLVSQVTPDGGTTYFWYDRLGRLVVSRNAQQDLDHEYSYTRYDGLGRIVETGIIRGNPTNPLQTPTETNLNAWNFPSSLANATVPNLKRYEVSLTYYDKVNAAMDDFIQYYSGSLVPENLRKRVSSVAYYDKLDYVSGAYVYDDYDYATHYSYDEHGNVKTLVQDKPHFVLEQQRYKRVDYHYDLVSGNVNEVHYQSGEFDQLFHRYSYDADNRITTVETSRDGLLWDRDAGYEYYRHGPLSRTEIGQLNVQGMDYAYTLQGWLKSVNSSTLLKARDMGRDGFSGGNKPGFASDAFAFSLHYNDQDYQPVGAYGTGTFEDPLADVSNMNIRQLYNGNIAAMVTSLQDNTGEYMASLGMRYSYDQLNRLHEAVSYYSYELEDPVQVNNDFDALGASDDYRVNLTYDANGNIKSLKRNGYLASGSLYMDQLQYHYDETLKNRLLYVADTVSSDKYTMDIDQQASILNYDAIGNIISDHNENIPYITWLANGKIKTIVRANTGNDSDLEFEYDAMGNRVTKIEKIRVNGTLLSEDNWIYTHYVRDASGNIMAVYREVMGGCLGCQHQSATHKIELQLKEHSLYGSDRLGIWAGNRKQTREVVLNAGSPPTVSDLLFIDYEDDAPYYSRKPGDKIYELKNHLGNVLVTVSGDHILTG